MLHHSPGLAAFRAKSQTNTALSYVCMFVAFCPSFSLSLFHFDLIYYFFIFSLFFYFLLIRSFIMHSLSFSYSLNLSVQFSSSSPIVFLRNAHCDKYLERKREKIERKRKSLTQTHSSSNGRTSDVSKSMFLIDRITFSRLIFSDGEQR